MRECEKQRETQRAIHLQLTCYMFEPCTANSENGFAIRYKSKKIIIFFRFNAMILLLLIHSLLMLPLFVGFLIDLNKEESWLLYTQGGGGGYSEIFIHT